MASSAAENRALKAKIVELEAAAAAAITSTAEILPPAALNLTTVKTVERLLPSPEEGGGEVEASMPASLSLHSPASSRFLFQIKMI